MLEQWILQHETAIELLKQIQSLKEKEPSDKIINLIEEYENDYTLLMENF